MLPGMDIRDLKNTFCRQVGVHPSLVKFSLYSYQRKKVLNDLREDATPEILGIGPDDVLKVSSLRFSNTIFYYLYTFTFHICLVSV